ncbi:type VII secretion system-associated protein [Streptomyces sp. H27-D2]|uniref:type VII secretion system-associated protein n=1 Tax=Streptomyces sp. H27-D2 TaxID=3046304 RepID=UPI002DB5D15A|nr:type VII secretion system-associated protein [Streptomyces sp. H27-D2]MEC4020218.1 type VII secretion system-associated protein [Streptomyces sp. H27-D2]
METPTDPAQAAAAGDPPPDLPADIPPDMPPVPEDIRAAARTAPDHWFGMVDPAWTGQDAPPAWAVIGQWRSDAHGEITEWQDNHEYRPSPGMLGWAEPADDVDAAVQLAATGYGPPEDVAAAAAAAELAVLTAPDGGPVLACAPDGGPVVPAFTSPVHLERAGALAHQVLPADRVFALVPDGHDLYLNPTGPVAMLLSAADLERAVRALTAAADTAAVDSAATAEPDPSAPDPSAPGAAGRAAGGQQKEKD